MAWSINPNETRTAVLFHFANGLAHAYAGRDGPERALVTVLVIGVCLLRLSAVVALAAPGLGQMQQERGGAWRGLWLEKNALGVAAASVALASIGRLSLRPSPWSSLFGLGLGVLVIFQAQSIAPLLALMAGAVAVIGCFSLRRGPLTAIALVTAGVLLISLMAFPGPVL
jgi:exopolysaccharide production protein ExoQ